MIVIYDGIQFVTTTDTVEWVIVKNELEFPAYKSATQKEMTECKILKNTQCGHIKFRIWLFLSALSFH